MTTDQHIRRLERNTAIRAWLLVYFARQAGIPLIITSSVRTAAQQAKLYRAGLSRTLNSRHLQGRAFDVDVKGMSRDRVPSYVWNWLSELAQWLDLTWGGNFKGFYDAGHFEYP